MVFDSREKGLSQCLKQPLFIIILALSPFILYALSLLLPTFDDWTYLTAPFFGRVIPDRIIPLGNYWRPLDGLFGRLLGCNYHLFPFLNHLFIYAAHVASAILVWLLAGRLGYRRHSQTLSALFFFISPAMLGTVLDIDSLNQAYSHLFGLMALWVYVNNGRTPVAYFLLVMLAVFSKENGAMWYAVCPLLAWGFGIIDSRRMRCDVAIAVLIGVVYVVLRLTLPVNPLFMTSDYTDMTFSRLAVNFAHFFVGMLVPVDLVSVIPAVYRNYAVAVVTFLLAAPLIVWLLFSRMRLWRERKFLVFLASYLLIGLPHLFTIFTAMHVYGGLSLVALLMGFLSDSIDKPRTERVLLWMWLVSAVFTDWHHWYASYESGLMGKRMAEQTIRDCGRPVEKVMIVNVKRPEDQRYSTFCVIPYDAFGWGNAVEFYSDYAFPKYYENTNIDITEMEQEIPRLKKRARMWGAECMWVVVGDSVSVEWL